MLAILRSAEALAGDQASTSAAGKPVRDELRQSTALSASLFAAPEPFSVPGALQESTFSKDFRPRAHSLFDVDPHLNVADDSLINDTTVWQRLSEYRAHDRVRVLTLWESGASTVSLQAGKHGDPSLQWTSRLMNHGGATRGLLDRLFSFSTAAESNGGAAHAIALPHAALPQPQKGATSLGALRPPQSVLP